MMIQYIYAVLTILPCPLWFISRYASTAFLLVVFAWSIYNGSTYYIDVFGKRFQKELEAMKAEVVKWQTAPELMLTSPLMQPQSETGLGDPLAKKASVTPGLEPSAPNVRDAMARTTSLDRIPLLDESATANSTGVDGGARDVARERRSAE